MFFYVDGFFLKSKKLYDKVILTNVLELYIISLKKAKNNKENKQEKLYKWLEFMNNPEEETRNGK